MCSGVYVSLWEIASRSSEHIFNVQKSVKFVLCRFDCSLVNIFYYAYVCVLRKEEKLNSLCSDAEWKTVSGH